MHVAGYRVLENMFYILITKLFHASFISPVTQREGIIKVTYPQHVPVVCESDPGRRHHCKRVGFSRPAVKPSHNQNKTVHCEVSALFRSLRPALSITTFAQSFTLAQSLPSA